MRRVLWIPTMRCFLQCEYCGSTTAIRKGGSEMSFWPELNIPYNKVYAIREKDPAYWVQTFAAMAPSLIDTCGGGEPTAYKGFPDVVAALPEHRFYVTSNLMGPVEPLLRLENFIHVTASYHYTELLSDARKRKFWDTVDMIRAARKGFAMTLVATPSKWTEFRRALDVAFFHNVRAPAGTPLYTLNVHLMTAPGMTWTEHQDKVAELEGLPMPLNVVTGLEHWRGGELRGPRNCQNGFEFGETWGPDGRRFRCFSHMVQNRPHPGGADHYCETPCEFPCDWDAPKEACQRR